MQTGNESKVEELKISSGLKSSTFHLSQPACYRVDNKAADNDVARNKRMSLYGSNGFAHGGFGVVKTV